MRKKSRFALSVLLVAASLAQPLRAAELPGPLVEVDWLAAHVADVFVLDVRANGDTFTERPGYTKDPQTGAIQLVQVGGHIPGAVYIPFAAMRTSRTIDGRKVDKMLPDKTYFEELLQSAGLRQTDPVVLVTEGEDAGDLTIAARVYWQLKYYGHDNVAILNGGMLQWLGARQAITTTATKKPKGNWRATAERRELLATSGDVAAAVKARDVQLIDTRDLAHYLGATKRPYVTAGGHIPGAKMLPYDLLVEHNSPARFRSPQNVKELAQALAIDSDKPSITYCNSGHLAAGNWFVLSELMGNKNIRLYDGSMHEWTLEKRPVTVNKME